MITFRIILFIITFSLNLKLKAEVLQEPEDCLKTTLNCLFKTENSSYEWKTQGKIVLGKGTTVYKEGSKIHLIKGKIWVAKSEGLSIDTELGGVEIPKKSTAYLVKEDVLRIRTLRGKLEVRTKDGETQGMAPFQETWVGPVGADGKNKKGVPQALDYKQHLKDWARLFDGNSSELLSEFKKFKEGYEKSIEETARLYQRSISSFQEQNEKQRHLEKAKTDLENQKIERRKKMFYEHTLHR